MTVPSSRYTLKNDREIALRAPIRLISDEVTIQSTSGSFLNQANNAGVTPTSIVLTGYAQTFTAAATVVWSYSLSNAQNTWTNLTINTTSSTVIPFDKNIAKYNGTTKIVSFGLEIPKDWFVNNIGTSVSMTFKCTIKENLKADSSGTTSIWYNKHGNNGVVIDLLSESDVVPASSSGAVSGTIPDNQIRIYSGGVLVDNSLIVYGLLNGTINTTTKTSSKAYTGLNVSVSTNTGLVKFTGASAWTSVFEVITFTATYFGTIYSANYTISKSKAGSDSVFIDLISEADVVSADYTGLVTTLPTSNAVRLYQGGVILNSGVTYAVGELTKAHMYATVGTDSSVTLNNLKCAVTTSGSIVISQPTNWIDTQQEQFTLYAKYLGTEYSSIYSIAKTLKGDTGEAGKKSVNISVYTWRIGAAPPAKPVDNINSSGTDMYIWSDGTFPIPGQGNAETDYIWSASAPTNSTSGAVLYVANLRVIDDATAPTTALDWSKSVIGSIGYRVDGSIGPQGPGACKMYCAITSGESFAPEIVVVTDDTSPYTKQMPGTTGTYWGKTGIVWKEAPPTIGVNQSLFTSDGVFDIHTKQTTWQTPYLANLKVGSLSAISAYLGTVQISTSGALYSGKPSYGHASKGFYLGADSNGYAKVDIGDNTNYLRWSGTTIDTSGLRVYANDGSLILSSGGPNSTSSSANLIDNSMPSIGSISNFKSFGWNNTSASASPAIAPNEVSLDSNMSGWNPDGKGCVFAYINSATTDATYGSYISLYTGNLMPVIENNYYEGSISVSPHRCVAYLHIIFYRANGTDEISRVAGYSTSGGTVDTAAPRYSSISSWGRVYAIAKAPVEAKFARIAAMGSFKEYLIIQGSAATTVNQPFLFTSCWYFGPAYATQTTPSPWSDKVIGQINTANADTYIKNLSIGFAKISDTLESTNYVANTSGWKLTKAGNLESNNGTFRGTVYANAGKFTGEVQATSGKFTGEVQATSGKFTGEVQATSGKFIGRIESNDGWFKGDISAAYGYVSKGLTIGTATYPDTSTATTITNSGAVFNSNGKFALGTSSGGNIVYNGSALYLNGSIVATDNIKDNAVTMSSGLSGNGSSVVYVYTTGPCKVHGVGYFTQSTTDGKHWTLSIGRQPEGGAVFASVTHLPIRSTVGSMMCFYEHTGGARWFAISITGGGATEPCGVIGSVYKK